MPARAEPGAARRLAAGVALGAALVADPIPAAPLVLDDAPLEDEGDLAGERGGEEEAEVELVWPYLHPFGSVALGRGLRFNNPYRLATPLGESAESLSLTATYLDASVAVTVGPADGLQHGGELALSVALEGVPQSVLTPSWVMALRLAPQLWGKARLGVPVLLGPDLNLGYEAGVGTAWMFTGALGVEAELVGSLFYGAATPERAASAIPLASFEVGLRWDWEVLP